MNSNGDPPAKKNSSRMPMPSLNQLAARMTVKDGASANGATANNANNTINTTISSTAAPRPRLAASILRTTSSVSLNSNTSSNDSMAVNPANSTRAASPSLSSLSTPRSDSTSTTPGPEGGESLTADKLDKLNSITSANPAPVDATSAPASSAMSSAAFTSTSTSTEADSTTDSGGPDGPAPPLGHRETKRDKGKPPVKGYKNIPSLDAITARLAKTRALSIDGTPKPPEPEMIEDPKTPGLHVMMEEHPLQYSWTIYHDSKSKFPYTPAPTSANPTGAAPSLVPKDRDQLAVSSFTASDSPTAVSHPTADPSQSQLSSQNPFSHAPGDYEANLTVIGTFTTVEQFCRYFNWLKPPSLLERNSNYHLFKSPIKPMWEDPANASGGKWVLTMRNNPELLDRCWGWLCMALVGEELEEGGDEICGAVVSLRAKVDRIQIWTRRRDDVEKLNAIGKKLVKLLDVGEQDGIGLEFQYNTEERGERGVPSKFLSIQAIPTTSSYRSTFQGLPGSAASSTGQHGGPGAGVGGPGSEAGGGHSHSRSIGGIGVGGSGGFTPVDQTAPPLSAGSGPANANLGNGAGAFGSFGVPLGTAGWRRRG
ncbi:translation initiation factor eIF4e [Lentinula aff. detonsa]|uniref:Translation initiation factor eIF4e n=1 Tax=Lentinula aff. detonsa TaxID=2804958 RepID=A0AA38NHV2_9AGAR|nr:translation initiation factor eIF4e [Lentinula aff. detonsa]